MEFENFSTFKISRVDSNSKLKKFGIKHHELTLKVPKKADVIVYIYKISSNYLLQCLQRLKGKQSRSR